MPTIGLEGGRINIVPVDFVVAALDHISHVKTDIDGSASTWSTRSATASATCSTSSAKAAHAPKMNLFVNAALLGFIPEEREEGPDGAGAGAAHQATR